MTVLAARSFYPAFAQEGPIEYAENSTDPVAVYTGTDPEGEDVNWNVTGPDEADFSIDENGVLTFDTPPNFEDPTDDSGTDTNLATDNLYEIIVGAHDGTIDDADTNDTTITVFVRVMDVNEPGVVTFDKFQPKVAISSLETELAKTRITATLMDPDGRKDDISNQDLTGTTDTDENIIPFLCDAAVFTLGGLMDSRFRGNDEWDLCCI